MSHCLPAVSGAAALAIILAASPAAAQTGVEPAQPAIHLAIEAGRALRVALDKRINVKQVGQPVIGRLVDAVYAYDRIVLPAGTVVNGHVARIENAPRGVRLRAILGGDFTPPRRAILEFGLLLPVDGPSIPIHTSATEGTERVVLRVADAPGSKRAARAREKIAEDVKRRASVVTAPDKKERLKVAVIRALPFHPLLLAKGTTYSARLLSRLELGLVTPAAPRAGPGAVPVPESILHAQLVTAVGSATSPRGTRIEAVLTQPVFASDGALILPEGSRLSGEVTFSRRARRFHRQGQLRFLFETIQAPDRQSESLLASLYAVDTSQRDPVSIDDEGGTKSTHSKARFAAPALGALALAGAMHGRLDYDTDGAGPEMQYGGASSSAVGGFLGLGLFGIGVNQLGRYASVTTAALGLARTAYSTIFGKGRDISFPLDTSIQVQLAPGVRAGSQRQEPR
jgi:hypothetical protein